MHIYELPQGDLYRLAEAVREHGCVVVPSLALDVAEFAELGEGLGRLIKHPIAEPGNSPTVTVLTRPGDLANTPIYGGAWHQNLAFLDVPPDVTLLHASKIGDDRNFTSFADLSELHQWISPQVSEMLGEVSALHSTRANDSPQNYFPGRFRDVAPIEALHPALVADEATGRTWTTVLSNYVVEFAGWHRWEWQPLVEALRSFGTQEEFTFRHYWSQGDLLAWDNSRLLHRATVSHFSGTRSLLRADLDVGWGWGNRVGPL